jgi:NAD(P)H-hydrate epimerase
LVHFVGEYLQGGVVKISSVREMRAMDRYAIEVLRIPEEILMENAGLASSFVLSRNIGLGKKKFVVLCGMGNNGGDGLVVARNILSNGGIPRVFIIGDPHRYKGAAKTNFEILSKLPVEIQKIKSVKAFQRDIHHCQGIVDAVFGTGLDRKVDGLYREVIELINNSGKNVLSLDIPSGVNGDTGEVMGTAVKAGFTVTFGLPKRGNMLYPGYELCGKLYVTHISFPPSLYDSHTIKVQINDFIKLPPRNPNAHKGSVGDVLFIAGASTYFGAPYFSALSFLKAGGGYSRLAAPKSTAAILAKKGAEIVFLPQKETREGSLSLENKKQLLGLSEKVDMVVIGPGVSLHAKTQQLVKELVEKIEKPILLDGDGITAVAQDMAVVKKRKWPTILTPHLGEMSRIVKRNVSDIDRCKIETLQNTAKNLGAFVVLKGAHSLIGTPDERVFINLSGNSGMATAGSGDVLTGTIAAMFGLGLPLEEAVRKGAFIHGLAGDLAASAKGEDGVTAQDILDYLPLAMKTDRKGFDETSLEKYSGPCIV